MPLHLRHLAHSEIGLVRKNNQDSGYASAHLLAVADGMGGAAAGDLASAVAIQLVRRADRSEKGDDPVEGEQMLELLAGSLHLANENIADLVADDHSLDGMGTTVTATMFDGSELGLVHIGDSRAYLMREGELTRLTHDHSWVQSLVDDGKISEEEAAFHPHRSLLLKVLNGQPGSDPDTSLVPVVEGDRLLLCSDGLCGLVEDDEIAEELAGDGELDEVLERLVAAAHREGGIDNITIVLADVVADPELASTEIEVLGAATERDVPVVARRSVELGDSQPARRTDAEGNNVPAAPEPGRADRAAAAPDEETTRYAPRPAPRGRGWRRGMLALLVLVVVAAIILAGRTWALSQYYVGPEAGHVAIHRGLSQRVLGVSLSQTYRVEETKLDDLPRYYRERVEQTISSGSLDQAEATVTELRSEAQKCLAQREARTRPSADPLPPNNSSPPPGEAPTPTPTPTPAPNDPGSGC